MKYSELRLMSVPASERKFLLPYLLMADSSEDEVHRYLFDGEMFSISYENKTAGVILFTFPEKGEAEVRNMALDPAYRGKGIGKRILHVSMEQFKKRGLQRMIVGTANSSLENIAFYQKAGFRMFSVKKNYFSGYSGEIYENGIRTLDMLMFEKEL
ncbi:GNAT family N-acetyltransferase [Alkalicoccus daliensis]|uniref:Acetyltransferase (GNAT) family protein n=1 Tax=Alkalicoccus daliensis TaxID=745820 RepID=A0A1H0EWE6_9BACI|nr:GNAT family N-acetyltransferase [Alkalicoccus daliensis]SDN86698.1 Acetyltransferase (GNAT) family protein [Alkalicoccus daliensis]